MTNNGTTARLADFSCAVAQSGDNDNDFEDMIAESLPPHIVPPEVWLILLQQHLGTSSLVSSADELLNRFEQRQTSNGRLF